MIIISSSNNSTNNFLQDTPGTQAPTILWNDITLLLAHFTTLVQKVCWVLSKQIEVNDGCMY